jgi:hypothetical protein
MNPANGVRIRRRSLLGLPEPASTRRERSDGENRARLYPMTLGCHEQSPDEERPASRRENVLQDFGQAGRKSGKTPPPWSHIGGGSLMIDAQALCHYTSSETQAGADGDGEPLWETSLPILRAN